jgi:hypothetical protein
MPKVEVRMYETLWKSIRDSSNGSVIVVFAPEKLHRRVAKALQKERARDKSFKQRDAKLLIIRKRDSASLAVQWKQQSGIEAGLALTQQQPLFQFYNVAGKIVGGEINTTKLEDV